MAGISKKCYRPQKENMEKLHYYCLKKSKYLKKFLEKYQVEYKEDVYLGCYYFELSDANQAYKKFLRYFGIYLLGEYPQIQNHYSEEEMQGAEWFVLECLVEKIHVDDRWKDMIMKCPYRANVFRREGYRHKKQIQELRVDSMEKLKKGRCFCVTNARLTNELFCNETAKEILGTNWIGLEYWHIRKKNTDEIIPEFYQMYFQKSLPIESIVCNKSVSIVKCPKCGMQRVYLKAGLLSGISFIQIKKEMLNDTSVYYMPITLDKKCIYNYDLLIISRKFYQLLKKYRIDKGLQYEPLQII